MTDTEKEVFKDAIMVYGVESQVDMAIEEMSELTKALLKYRRIIKGDKTCGDKTNVLTNIVEETEDVGIMLDQIRLIYGDGEGFRKEKVERLKQRLKGGRE